MAGPHAILGVSTAATADEIRTARRELARTHHPDAGGDAGEMQRINEAAEIALEQLTARAAGTGGERRGDGGETAETTASTATGGFEDAPGWIGDTRDMPSFTVEALPVEAFEALLVVAAEIGEIIDDEPPYELRVLLGSPLHCWCQLDVVPDAGGSTVSVSIAALEDQPLPPLVDVRNALITALNVLDWSRPDNT